MTFHVKRCIDAKKSLSFSKKKDAKKTPSIVQNDAKKTPKSLTHLFAWRITITRGSRNAPPVEIFRFLFFKFQNYASF